MSKYSDEYLNYLHSDKWKEQRAKAFAHDGNMCAICGSTEHLDGHHIRYGLMGTEQDWLEVLTVCHDCHEKLEDIKAEDQQRISKIAGCRLPEDHSDLSKFFTQTLRILKELKMEELIRKADAEAVMRAVRIQKELGRLEIRID